LANALKIEITFGEFIKSAKPKEVKGIKDGKLRYDVLSVKEVLSQLETQYLKSPSRQVVEIGEGYKVKFRLKLLTFLKKGCFCYKCNLKGEYFAIERDQIHALDEPRYFQLNMYNGDVLFTHDHIKARCFGGVDDIGNTCTMCTDCNSKKAEFEGLHFNRLKSLVKYEIALDKLRDKYKCKP